MKIYKYFIGGFLLVILCISILIGYTYQEPIQDANENEVIGFDDPSKMFGIPQDQIKGIPASEILEVNDDN